MAGRYSLIKRGAELDLALDNYVTYIRTAATRPTKRMQGGTRGARRQTVAAALRPFGVDLGTNPTVAVRVGLDSSQEMATAFANRLTLGDAAQATAQKIQGFRPARCSAFRGTGAAAYKQSRVTKLYYLDYTGDSFGFPFGALSGAEEEYAGGVAVKAAVLTAFGSADIKRVSITPEKVPV